MRTKGEHTGVKERLNNTLQQCHSCQLESSIPVVNCSYGKAGFTFTSKRRRHELVLHFMRLVGDGLRRKI